MLRNVLETNQTRYRQVSQPAAQALVMAEMLQIAGEFVREPAPPLGPGLEPDTANLLSAGSKGPTGAIQPHHPLPRHSLRKGADLGPHLKW